MTKGDALRATVDTLRIQIDASYTNAGKISLGKATNLTDEVSVLEYASEQLNAVNAA